MIRFSDIAEKESNAKSIEKHTDIKPSDRMTDHEADAFWKTEFQKAHDEVRLDEYDTLLSEACDCLDNETHCLLYMKISDRIRIRFKI